MINIQFLNSVRNLIREGLLGNGSRDLFQITRLISEIKEGSLGEHYILEEASNDVLAMLKGASSNSNMIIVLEGEEEDIFGGGDDEEDAGEEDADEEDADEEGADEEGADEEGTDEEEKEEEPTGPVDTMFDAAISDLYTEFEGRAIDTASEEKVAYENRDYSISRILTEEEQLFDVRVFAREVANLINNYEHLLDVEYLLYKKAVDFIEKKYGQIVSNDFIDTLKSDYSLSFSDEPAEVATPDAQQKYAIGAMAAE